LCRVAEEAAAAAAAQQQQQQQRNSVRDQRKSIRGMLQQQAEL